MNCHHSTTLRKTRYDYSHLSAGFVQLVVLSDLIDVRPFYYVQLFIRFHERVWSADQTITFYLANTLPSEEDNREFTASTALVSLTTSASGAAPVPLTVPGLASVSVSNPGPFLKLYMLANQDPSVAGIFFSEISAEIFARSS